MARALNGDVDYLERLMGRLEDELGTAGVTSIAEDVCISVDVEIFGIIGSLREAEYLVASGIREAGLMAIHESMEFLVDECERRGCSEGLTVRLKKAVKGISSAVKRL